MSILELKDVRYTYKNKYQTVEAVKGISVSFEQGRVYAIIGKSGSGKSTMLSLMAGLSTPTEGDVLYEGVSTKDIKLDDYRKEKVSVIYQSFHLMPLLTATENVMYPLELRKMKAQEAEEISHKLILEVGLPDTVFNRLPSMLSGGEQQRVAIARALAMDTKLLLADEPTGNIDEENSDNIIRLLVKLAKEKNYAVIIVTHDLGILPKVDEVYRMKDGFLVKFEPN